MNVKKIKKVVIFTTDDEFCTGDKVKIKVFGQKEFIAIIDTISDVLGENCTIGFETENKEWFPIQVKNIENMILLNRR